MTPPLGIVQVPGVEPGVEPSVEFDVARERGFPRAERAPASWAPLLGHPGFALWLRTPPAVAATELADVDARVREMAPWAARRFARVLDLVAAYEVPVFLGTCAETLQRALEPANGGDAAVLDAPHLAGFILRGDPDEGAIARVRARLDARGAAHLALGRSMHGMPRPPRCTDDPSSAATVADFTLVAPFRPAITAKPPGTELRDTCPRVPPEHGAGGAAGGDVFARPRASTPLSAAGLSRWIAATPHVVAMGGIDVASGSEAVALGAEGIAGIDAFFGDASRVAQNALAFAALFPRA